MDKELTYEEFQRRVGGAVLTEGGSCPVTQVTHMLQGKWKLEILYQLCKRSPLRFGELRKMLGDVTHTMLTNALRELETDGLIHREQFNEIPPHVEYALTERGKDLLPVFYAMANGA